MVTGQSLDWQSSESLVLLNPKWSTDTGQILKGLAKKFAKPAHVWIASSGSSAVEQKSVKLMALSKEAFLVSAQAVNDHLQVTAQDTWIQCLPEFHVGGQAINARAYLSNSKVVSGIQADWNPHFYQRQIIDHRATLGALVPTQVYDLIQQKLKSPPTLRAVIVGGAHLSDELYNQALDLGWPLLPSYGLTECCSQVGTAQISGLAKRDRSLYLLNHIEASIKDEKLQIKSGALLTGFAQHREGQDYWWDPKLAGHYQTEDRVHLDGKKLSILGRDADFVKILGEGVNLSLLQTVLETCVKEVAPSQPLDFAVAAMPHLRKGSMIVLVAVQTVSDGTVARICSQFNAKVAPYERIEEVRRVSEIPRTELGKISKARLQAIL